MSSFSILRTTVLTILVTASLVGAAGAQGMPGVESNKCLAKKSRCVFQLAQRLATCDDKCILNPKDCESGLRACQQKVLDRFAGGDKPERGCFAKAEAKQKSSRPSSLCLTSGDSEEMAAAVEAAVGDLISQLIPPVCGDGEVNDEAEDCDGADLAGASCGDFGHTHGQVVCDDQCQFDSSGCATCTSDVKVCPDGSAVGRTGPDCRFAPCPCEKYGIDCPVVNCPSLPCEDGQTFYGCTGTCYLDPGDDSCSGVVPVDVCFE